MKRLQNQKLAGKKEVTGEITNNESELESLLCELCNMAFDIGGVIVVVHMCKGKGEGTE